MNSLNPLRDTPHPLIITAVTRFGLPGLIACALCAALVRGYSHLPLWLLRLTLTLAVIGVLMLVCPSFDGLGGQS